MCYGVLRMENDGAFENWACLYIHASSSYFEVYRMKEAIYCFLLSDEAKLWGSQGLSRTP